MSPRNQTVHRRCECNVVRRLVEAGVLLGIAGIVTNEFLVEGWLVPIVVSSGSMATTLLGPHRVARCPDCGMEFVCDAQSASPATAATCPNCGRGDIPLDSQIIRGDRLLVDRATFDLRNPRRWEVALFRCRESAGDYCVKRVVGLPGETIEIRGGDVYVNGTIARKSLKQQREMAVLIHDTAWSGSNHRLPNRWSAEAGNGWRRDADRWQFSAREGTRVSKQADIQWLNYVHWRPTIGSHPVVEESSILDEDSYNQTASRQLNRVNDLMLVCSLSTVGDGELAFKANDGRENFQVSIIPTTGAITLEQGGRIVESNQATPGILAQPTELVLSLIDRQFVLAVAGRELFNYPFDPLSPVVALSPDRVVLPTEGLMADRRPLVGAVAWSGDHATTSSPFSIGTRGLDVHVKRLQIYRDVYYTPATRVSDSNRHLLGPDEYFVLGDNSPISRDSRPWTGGELVRRSSFVGRPLAVFRRHAVAE